MKYFHQREQLTEEMKEALGMTPALAYAGVYLHEGDFIRRHRNWIEEWINDDWVILGHQNRGYEPSYSLWERKFVTIREGRLERLIRKIRRVGVDGWRYETKITWRFRGVTRPTKEGPACKIALALTARRYLEFDCLDHNMDACHELERLRNE